jgi:hypothetical protein
MSISRLTGELVSLNANINHQFIMKITGIKMKYSLKNVVLEIQASPSKRASERGKQ